MKMRSSSGPLNEYFPESHFCASPDGKGNENICPEDEVRSKRSRKDGKLNLRKSLAWNPAFFTEEGVLDACELSTINDSVTRPSCKLLSKTDVEGSSMMQFDKFSKRPPLNNLEEIFLSKVHSSSMSRSSKRMAANLLSTSEKSKQNDRKMSMRLRKTPSARGITGNVRKLEAACLMLEKVKTTKVQPEKDTTILRLNSYPSSSNRSPREMSSTPTDTTCLVKEKAQKFCGLPFAPIQAKQSSLRMPSSHGRLEIFEKDPILLKLSPCPSSSTISPMDKTCSGSAGIFPSISQQTFNAPGLPHAPIQAKPSALRMPSPSLGFFRQKMTASSSHSHDLHSTSQVPFSNIPSQRKPTNLKRVAPCNPPVVQTEQQPKKDFEAHNMEMKPFGKNGTISSSVCGKSNCISDEIMTNCLSVSHNMDEKTREELLGKPCTGRTMESEITDENCSNSQICSKPSTEGSGMIGKVQDFNYFENTNGSIQFSGGSIITEICPTPSEMDFPQNLDESNSKPSSLHAPVMNGELVMHKDVCVSSEEASLYIEARKDSTEVGSLQNGEEHFDKTRSQVQQSISGKSQTIQVHANSQDVQLAASEGCHTQDDLLLCKPRNETSLVEEKGLMPDKKISFDNLKQDTVLLKQHLSAVPYSEEWLAAIEAFGEDILEVKTGTVHNSPPDTKVAEPGPWSPVKRKAQDVGPFDCTKYTVKPLPWEE